MTRARVDTNRAWLLHWLRLGSDKQELAISLFKDERWAREHGDPQFEGEARGLRTALLLGDVTI
jgi:hypothetical protein